MCPTEVPDFDVSILACRPLNFEDCSPEVQAVYQQVIDSGVPMPPVYPGSIFKACEECGVTVIVGPNQQLLLDDPDRATKLLCIWDATLLSAQEIGLSGSMSLGHLGNTYVQKDQ